MIRGNHERWYCFFASNQYPDNFMSFYLALFDKMSLLDDVNKLPYHCYTDRGAKSVLSGLKLNGVNGCSANGLRSGQA